MVAVGKDASPPAVADIRWAPGGDGTLAGATNGLRRGDLVVMFALGAIAVGIPLAMVVAAGGVGLASNDDWVYMRGALTLYRTGAIDIPGHTASTLGQLALVQPMLWLTGGATWVFTAYGLLMGLLAVTSTYLLGRLYLGRGSAALAAGLLLVYPGLGRQLPTFMTDMPACALSLLCLLLGVLWLRGTGRRVALVGSLSVGLLAVSIREFAVAAPAAILAAAWIRNRRTDRVLLPVSTAAFAVGILAIELIGQSVANRGAPSTFDPTPSLYSIPAFMTMSAALLPAAILAIGRRLVHLRAVHIVIALSLVSLGMVAVPDGPFVGYIWAPGGSVSDALLMGSRAQVIPPRIWVLSEQLALIASIFVLAVTLRYLSRRLELASVPSLLPSAVLAAARRAEAPLVLFVLAYGAAMVAFGTFFPLYDRYLYPLIPTGAILLLLPFRTDRPPLRAQAFSHAALLWLACSAFLIDANSFAYDAARFREGEAAVAAGYAADTVDAGPEWVGFHAAGHETPGAHQYGLMPYNDIWIGFYPCAVLANSPVDLPGFALIRHNDRAYLNYLFVGDPEPLYLYGSTSTRCPAVPTALSWAEPSKRVALGAYTAAWTTDLGTRARGKL